MVLIAWALLIIGLILLVVGVLAWTGKLRGNGMVGINIPATRKNEFYWAIAHKVAGPIWVVGAITWILAALLAFRAEGWMWILVAVAAFAGLVIYGSGAAMGANAATTVAKANPDPAPEGCCSAGGNTNESNSCGDAAGGCGGDCSSGGCGDKGPAVDVNAARRAARRSDNT